MLLVLVLSPFTLSAEKWISKTEQLQKVYISKSRSNNIEVLRLYNDNTYIRVRYHKSSYSCINTGTYHTRGVILYMDRPSTREFSASESSVYLAGKKGLYNSFFSNGLSPSWELVTDSIYNAPFYLNPLNGQVIRHKDAAEKLDLADLVKYLVKGSNNDIEKAYRIARFVCNTITYGQNHREEWSKTEKLSGKYRTTVCSGYSGIFCNLAELAGLEARYVGGNAQNSIYCSYTLPAYNHAWNQVKIDGKWRSIDVTWMDGSEELDMEWFFPSEERMLLTHIPKDIEEFPVEGAIDLPVLEKLPYIRPYTSGDIPDFFPKTGIVYCDSLFNFKVNADEDQKIFLTKLPASLANVSYETESNGYSYVMDLSQKTTLSEDGLRQISYSLEDTITVLMASVNGVADIHYLVVKGDESYYMDYLISIARPDNIYSYVKGILACIKQNDARALAELMGNDRQFFDAKGRISVKPQYRKAINLWDGRLSAYSTTRKISFDLYSDYSASKDYTCFSISDDCKILFEKTEEGYTILGFCTEVDEFDEKNMAEN